MVRVHRTGRKAFVDTAHVHTLGFFELKLCGKGSRCLHGAGLWPCSLHRNRETEPSSSFLSGFSEVEDADRMSSAMVLAVPSMRSQHLKSHRESLPGRGSGDKTWQSWQSQQRYAVYETLYSLPRSCPNSTCLNFIQPSRCKWHMPRHLGATGRWSSVRLRPAWSASAWFI